MKTTLHILLVLTLSLILPNQADAYVFSKENNPLRAIFPPQYGKQSNRAIPQDSTKIKQIEKKIERIQGIKTRAALILGFTLILTLIVLIARFSDGEANENPWIGIALFFFSKFLIIIGLIISIIALIVLLIAGASKKALIQKLNRLNNTN